MHNTETITDRIVLVMLGISIWSGRKKLKPEDLNLLDGETYSMTRPIRLAHLDDCAAWWGGPQRQGRVETERAWKVSAEEIKARNYNLDIKNPHVEEEDHGDPETLLEELTNAEAEVVAIRDQLKQILSEALLR